MGIAVRTMKLYWNNRSRVLDLIITTKGISLDICNGGNERRCVGTNILCDGTEKKLCMVTTNALSPIARSTADESQGFACLMLNVSI